MKSTSGIHIFVPIIIVTAMIWLWNFTPKIIKMKLTCCYCCHYCHSSSAKKRQDLVCWGNWGITYLVCMIYEIIGELTRLLLTLTIVFTMMRMKERKDEMEKHLWPNSLNSDNVTSSTADSILNQAYCKKWNGTLLSDRIVCTLYFLISKDIWQM